MNIADFERRVLHAASYAEIDRAVAHMAKRVAGKFGVPFDDVAEVLRAEAVAVKRQIAREIDDDPSSS